MTILLFVLVILLFLFAVGYLVFLLTVVKLPFNPLLPHGMPDSSAEQSGREGAAWFHAQDPERIVIPARDGLRLCGYFLPAAQAKGTLLLVHGYRSSSRHDFGVAFPYYHSLGWNILAIDQRAHGESGGSYITMGIKERFDVCDWSLYLADRFGPEHKIVLGGISMGSSTVLMALGTNLPDNVKGVVADCGYTCPYDEFLYAIRQRHLPAKPLLALAELHTRTLAGFRLKEYSTVTALQQNRRPVLFFHGEADNLVPVRFTVENYAACAGEKQLLTVPKAGHGESYLLATKQYQDTLEAFLAKL